MLVKQVISVALLTMVASALPQPEAVPDTWPPDGTYYNTALKHHNVHRANHSAPAAQWGPNMASYAARLARTCVYKHDVSINDHGEVYGQNIAGGVPPTHVSQAITDLFYYGEVGNYAGQYGKTNPDFSGFGGWGHFSQLVWKGTKKIGCATQDCTAMGGLKDTNGNVYQGIGPYFTVCNYYPPGNIAGQYGANIGRPLGKPTVNAQYKKRDEQAGVLVGLDEDEDTSAESGYLVN